MTRFRMNIKIKISIEKIDSSHVCDENAQIVWLFLKLIFFQMIHYAMYNNEKYVFFHQMNGRNINRNFQ